MSPQFLPQGLHFRAGSIIPSSTRVFSCISPICFCASRIYATLRITPAGCVSSLGPVGIFGSRGNIIPFPHPKVGNAKTGDLYSGQINDDESIKINHL